MESSRLDTKQLELSSWFEGSAQYLQDKGEDDLRDLYLATMEHDKGYVSNLDLRIGETLDDEQTQCTKLASYFYSIAGDVPSMSTSAYEHIDPTHSHVYLEQEIKREEYKILLRKWQEGIEGTKKSMKNFGYINDPDVLLDEEMLCTGGLQRLRQDLSSLPEYEEIRRACYILGEIRIRKRQTYKEILAGPVQNPYGIASKYVLVVGALVDTINTLILGTAELITEYGVHYRSKQSILRELQVPYLSCMDVVRNSSDLDFHQLEKYMQEVEVARAAQREIVE